jgi:hypothetical protein
MPFLVPHKTTYSVLRCCYCLMTAENLLQRSVGTNCHATQPKYTEQFHTVTCAVSVQIENELQIEEPHEVKKTHILHCGSGA